MEVNGKEKSKKELKVENRSRLEEIEKTFLILQETTGTCKETLTKLKMKGESSLFDNADYFLKPADIILIKETIVRMKFGFDFRSYKLQIKLSGEIEELEQKLKLIDELISKTKVGLKMIIDAKDNVNLKIIEVQRKISELELFVKFGKHLPQSFVDSVESINKEFLQIKRNVNDPVIKIHWLNYQTKLSVLAEEILLLV